VSEAKDFNLESWFEEEIKVDAVTLQNFDVMVKNYFDEKEKAEEIEAALTQQNKKIMAMQSKLIAYLDHQSITKHTTSRGSIIKVETRTYKPPDGEEKENLLQHLRESGNYDAVMAFNAKKFSAWYKTEKENNPEFNLSGVEPVITTYIRKGK
jgi:hypothetical protein